MATGEPLATVGQDHALDVETDAWRAINEIWGEMEGDIWVLHSAWNRNRVLSEIVRDMSDPLNERGQKLVSLGLNSAQVVEVVETISRYGNHVVEGDVIAKDHILSVLRCLYPPDAIRTLNTWALGHEVEQVEGDARFQEICSRSNVIVLCGPVGNLASSVLLKRAGLSWLFPEDALRRHAIRIHPDADQLLAPEGYPPDRLTTDVGVFLRCRNPYNPHKRMFAAMGAYAFGTQGAAALACSYESAAELLSAPVDGKIRDLGVDHVAWAKVWKPDELLTDFRDEGIRYQIVHPSHPKGFEHWLVHKNPSSIVRTLKNLRKFIMTSVTTVLPPRPAKLVSYTLSLIGVLALIGMTVMGWGNPYIVLPLLFAASTTLVRALARLSSVP